MAALLPGGCQTLKRESTPRLRLELHTIPETIAIEDSRRFLAELVAVNQGRSPAVINSPTQQMAEAELFSPEGQLLHRWSDDRFFSNEPSLLLLNPGERAFFEMVMPSRGMTPGKPHKLIARVIGFPELETSITIIPTLSHQR